MMKYNIPDSLKEKIKQDKVAIFVGAGISTGAGLPNWVELIEIILDGLSSKESKSQKLKQALSDELLTPIEILGKIEHLKTTAIEIFYHELSKYKHLLPTSVHSKIGQLSNQIITTNYDNFLEQANNEFEKIPYTNTFKIAKLSDINKYIFKIHGDIEVPDKCILFPSQYEELYSDEKSSTFEIKKIISDRSILFIGFSLSDPYVQYVFNYVNNLYSGFSPEHYLITTSANNNLSHNINPIIIEQYSDLEHILDELIEIRSVEKKEEEDIKQNIEEDSNHPVINISKSYDIDSPPSNKYWVGREKELQNIGNENFKVIFITGIGGQGKSALASHYVGHYVDPEIYEFGDWRDFKEQTNRFHTKLGAIIKRLTREENTLTLEQLTIEQLVDSFFIALGKRRIVFVFDNIDSYVDLETFRPTGVFKYFFEQALAQDHCSKFLFTCRPFIREASINFYQISLSGVSEIECEELFKFYNIPFKKEELKVFSNRVHKLTKGHPLWLNLIAGQAIRGIDTVNDFISRIENKTNFDENDFSVILSEKILTEVWNSLNDKQRVLLRGLSETVKPESEESLKIILQSELSNNQFSRGLRTLKNLNLVESLSDGELELHPLVKEFIISKYPNTERAKFITLLVQYYDKVIYILKPKLGSNLTYNEFLNWTSKVELEINKRDFQSALICLEEVRRPLLIAGYSEEYLRVSEMLYNAVDWEKAVSQEYTYFHDHFITLTHTQTHMGMFEVCENNLNKYVGYIPGKSSHYLAYCSSKTYNYWYQGLFSKAISIAEEGLYLMNESSINDNFALRHNHALALRDSKEKENVMIALDYFLMNEKLEEILLKEKINVALGGHYYGNIGKCLEYLEDRENALFCYLVSLKILLDENDINSILNKGYACFWIYNVLPHDQLIDKLYFLKYALICWGKASPPKTKELEHIWDKINCLKTTKEDIEQSSEWKIENHCKDYIRKSHLI